MSVVVAPLSVAADSALARLRQLLVTAWGMPLPMRDTALLGVVTAVLVLTSYHSFFADSALIAGRSLDRLLLYGVVPLAALLLLGQRPSQYGLRFGHWQLGLGLLLAAAAGMTPIIIWFSQQPDTISYYAPLAGQDLGRTILSTFADVGPAEFLFRGLLMGVLVRHCGPFGVVIATFPFVFTHLGKPEIETLSCFFGGIGFGWLAWRTGSVLYGGLLHTYILTLLLVLSA